MPSPDLMKPSPDIIQVGPMGPDGLTGNGLKPIFGADRNNPNSYLTPENITEGNPYYGDNIPGMKEVYDNAGLSEEYNAHYGLVDDQDRTGYEKDESQVHDNEAVGASLAEYLQQHPGASYMDALKYMSQYSDEWAEKYIDYIAEQEGLEKANAYTAQREDTAYQRLVADLRAAGLNPAMMYGSSASPIGPSGSQGYVKTTEGATSRGISNYSKIQKLILAYLGYELQKNLGTVEGVFKGVDSIFNAIGKVLPFIG